MLSETMDEAFEHVINEMMALNHVFVQDNFSIDQLGSDNAKYFFSVRDSIMYRTNSLRWHTHHLISLHANLETQIHSDFLDGNETAQMLLPHQTGLHYLFDDVIFGNISLLDYVANLVGLVFEGFARRGKYKWNTAHKYAKDHEPLSSSETGNLIKQAHKDWVDKLQSYRGDLIHERTILGDVSHQWKFDASGIYTSLRVSIPAKHQKLFVNMSSSEGEHDLCSAAETVGVMTSNLSAKILSSLTTRIRTNSDKEWIRDKNEIP